jgi:acyl-coenzyme A synthetase/AMP-(fatty) acid ligase
VLIRPDLWRARSRALPPGAYVASSGDSAGLGQEALTLAALLPALIAGVSELDLVATSEPAQWLGAEDLHPVSPTDTGGRLRLRTSGTTGEPKVVTISIPERTRVVDAEPEARWLLCYAAGRWATISVVLHVVAASSTLVVPDSLAAGAILLAGVEGGATHLAITPSLFRILLATDPDRTARLPLTQVTFGGEAASQAILDAAARTWPAARITHVLAATETGDICAASDGLAGFPWSRIERAGGRLTDTGELIVNGYATGDIWERRGDRIHHAGRVQEIINVGGAKVSPVTVEEAATAQPGVEAAAAYAISSPILGQIVGLDVVGDVDTRELATALRKVLPKVAWPSSIRVVDSLVLSDAGKTLREAR